MKRESTKQSVTRSYRFQPYPRVFPVAGRKSHMSCFPDSIDERACISLEYIFSVIDVPEYHVIHFPNSRLPAT